MSNDIPINSIGTQGNVAIQSSQDGLGIIQRTFTFPNTIIEQHYHIDSRKRNVSRYPNPNNYRIRLPRIKNVVQIELLAASIPKGDTNVHAGNNTFCINYNGTDYDITLPVGQYDLGAGTIPGPASDLLLALKTALDTATGGTFDIELVAPTSSPNSNQQVLRISAGASFYFKFGSEIASSANELLGFARANTVNGVTVDGLYAPNMNGDPEYIIMSINPNPEERMDDRVRTNALDSFQITSDEESLLKETFAVIYFDNNANKASGGIVKSLKGKDFDPKVYTFDLQNRTNIDVLHIQFKICGGQYYNFNGAEHSLIFKITSDTSSY